MQEKIRVDALSYTIQGKQILQDASILVEKGKKVGIIGPNGSGKTTLLKHIYRALPVNKETIYLEGTELDAIDYREVAKRLAVMKQENVGDFDMKVLDMVLLGRAPYHTYFDNYTGTDLQIAKKALAFVGMEEATEKSFYHLSGGEKQRVLIARAITQGTDLIVLDEPTNHLDVHYQWAIMELISQMNKTVLGVFHELNLAAKFCDYLYVLNQGRIVCSGSPDKVITEKLMAEIFRVKAKILIQENNVPYIIFQGTI